MVHAGIEVVIHYCVELIYLVAGIAFVVGCIAFWPGIADIVLTLPTLPGNYSLVFSDKDEDYVHLGCNLFVGGSTVYAILSLYGVVEMIRTRRQTRGDSYLIKSPGTWTREEQEKIRFFARQGADGEKKSLSIEKSGKQLKAAYYEIDPELNELMKKENEEQSKLKEFENRIGAVIGQPLTIETLQPDGRIALCMLPNAQNSQGEEGAGLTINLPCAAIVNDLGPLLSFSSQDVVTEEELDKIRRYTADKTTLKVTHLPAVLQNAFFDQDPELRQLVEGSETRAIQRQTFKKRVKNLKGQLCQIDKIHLGDQSKIRCYMPYAHHIDGDGIGVLMDIPTHAIIDHQAKSQHAVKRRHVVEAILYLVGSVIFAIGTTIWDPKPVLSKHKFGEDPEIARFFNLDRVSWMGFADFLFMFGSFIFGLAAYISSTGIFQEYSRYHEGTPWQYKYVSYVDLRGISFACSTCTAFGGFCFIAGTMGFIPVRYLGCEEGKMEGLQRIGDAFYTVGSSLYVMATLLSMWRLKRKNKLDAEREQAVNKVQNFVFECIQMRRKKKELEAKRKEASWRKAMENDVSDFVKVRLRALKPTSEEKQAAIVRAITGKVGDSQEEEDEEQDDENVMARIAAHLSELNFASDDEDDANDDESPVVRRGVKDRVLSFFGLWRDDSRKGIWSRSERWNRSDLAKPLVPDNGSFSCPPAAIRG